MKTSDLLSILTEFHRDKLTLRERHVAVARHVWRYEFNNTYQYVIAREDIHLRWLELALAELGGTPEAVPPPSLGTPGRKGDFVPLVGQDGRDAAAFVARWRSRVDALTHARHRAMLGVILGETLEHERFFAQIVAGRDDVLGRQANGRGASRPTGAVLPDRWVGD